MKSKLVPATTLFLACAIGEAIAAPATPAFVCERVAGYAQLTPDPTCKILISHPGGPLIGRPQTCFSVTLKSGGMRVGTGSAGLTFEITAGALGGVLYTPAILNEGGVSKYINELGQMESREFFTGRSVISLQGGSIYTADAGVMRHGSAAEQLLITKGTGRYRDASGEIFVGGQEIGGWAAYHGRICRCLR
jgi:hypothetical protein